MAFKHPENDGSPLLLSDLCSLPLLNSLQRSQASCWKQPHRDRRQKERAWVSNNFQSASWKQFSSGQFSLFSIVTFPNDPCTPVLASTLTGAISSSCLHWLCSSRFSLSQELATHPANVQAPGVLLMAIVRQDLVFAVSVDTKESQILRRI